jgi:hypothetical protein
VMIFVNVVAPPIWIFKIIGNHVRIYTFSSEPVKIELWPFVETFIMIMRCWYTSSGATCCDLWNNKEAIIFEVLISLPELVLIVCYNWVDSFKCHEYVQSFIFGSPL